MIKYSIIEKIVKRRREKCQKLIFPTSFPFRKF